jgi:hypothetical protein
MTTVEESEDIAGTGRRLLGAAAMFVTFVVVGPPVGGAVMFLALLGLDAVPPDFASDPGGAYFFSSLTVALPVVVTGGLIAARHAMGRPMVTTLAAGLGAMIGVVWSLLLASEGAVGTLSTLAFVGSTVATLACLWLTRILPVAR